MTIITVWVCVIFFAGNGTSTTTVDNIATRADCERIGKRVAAISGDFYVGRYTCTQVKKVVVRQ